MTCFSLYQVSRQALDFATILLLHCLCVNFFFLDSIQGSWSGHCQKVLKNKEILIEEKPLDHDHPIKSHPQHNIPMEPFPYEMKYIYCSSDCYTIMKQASSNPITTIKKPNETNDFLVVQSGNFILCMEYTFISNSYSAHFIGIIY